MEIEPERVAGAAPTDLIVSPQGDRTCQMTILYCVFDTNLYRELKQEQFAELQRLEATQAVTPIASLWPCKELLAHCADPTDKDYSRALAAVQKLWKHAGYESDGLKRLRMPEDGETQLARGLLGQPLEARRNETDAIAELVSWVGTRDTSREPSDVTQRLEAVALGVVERETKFALDLDAFAQTVRSTESARPDSMSPDEVRRDLREFIRGPEGLHLIAKLRVQETAVQVGVNLSAKDLEKHTQTVLKAFPTAMYFLRDLISDLLDSQFDMSRSRNRNSTWDLSLAFQASRAASIGGVPVLLVSGDKRIARAATAARDSEFVRTLADYERLLGSGALPAYANTLRREGAA
jgi:hypothetical protein